MSSACQPTPAAIPSSSATRSGQAASAACRSASTNGWPRQRRTAAHARLCCMYASNTGRASSPRRTPMPNGVPAMTGETVSGISYRSEVQDTYLRNSFSRGIGGRSIGSPSPHDRARRRPRAGTNDHVGRHRNMRCAIRYLYNICCQQQYNDNKRVRSMHLHRDEPGRVRRGRRRRVAAEERTCARPTRCSRHGRTLRGGSTEAATAVVGTSRQGSGARIGDARAEGKRSAIVRASALAVRAAGRRSAMHGRHGPAKNSDTMQTMPANQTSDRSDAQFSRYISA